MATTTVTVQTTTAAPEPRSVEMADLVKLGRFLLAKPDSELSEGDCSFYDKDGNGKLNVFDLIILRQYAAGMIGQTAAS